MNRPLVDQALEVAELLGTLLLLGGLLLAFKGLPNLSGAVLIGAALLLLAGAARLVRWFTR